MKFSFSIGDATRVTSSESEGRERNLVCQLRASGSAREEERERAARSIVRAPDLFRKNRGCARDLIRTSYSRVS